MDDFKKRTEDGLKTLKETAGDIAFSVEKQARIARKKMDLMKIRRSIQKVYSEVGEYVYGEYAMQRPINMESPFLKDRMASISEMKADAREIEEEIEKVRTTQPPSREPKTPEDPTA
jgi:vacuolar-type H+-ATPase subunit H